MVGPGSVMPYSFLHIAALRNDVVKAQQLIDGEAADDVHVWRTSMSPGASLGERWALRWAPARGAPH